MIQLVYIYFLIREFSANLHTIHDGAQGVYPKKKSELESE